MFGKLAALVSYFCVATVFTAVGGAVYLRANGTLNDERLEKAVAVLQGKEIAPPGRQTEPDRKAADAEQPSYEDRELARDLRARNLELREQTLNSRLELVRSELRTLMTDKDRHERLKVAFKEQMASLRDETITSGMEKVRLIFENIKPKQAKEQIMQMIESDEINEVVSILSAMPIDKRAEIVSEFKTHEDAVKLDEILRLIREGVPQTTLIDKTLRQLQP